jgi:hypothetical protein
VSAVPASSATPTMSTAASSPEPSPGSHSART